MSSMRFLSRLVLPVVIVVGAAGAAGAQSPEVQQACTPDAQRLCGQFIPDREKVTACMTAHRREWSAACRTAIAAERHVARGHRVYRHHGTHHYRHHHEH
jgi:hypothetical protein